MKKPQSSREFVKFAKTDVVFWSGNAFQLSESLPAAGRCGSLREFRADA